MKTDLSVLKKYCDKLNLGDKSVISFQDWISLNDLLKQNSEYELSSYVESLKNENELEDLLVNIIYYE